MTNEIKVDSGVSWLHDELRKRIADRKEYLRERTCRGVPDTEYKQFVGRYNELREFEGLVAEIFKDFYQSDEDDDDTLGDLDESE